MKFFFPQRSYFIFTLNKNPSSLLKKHQNEPDPSTNSTNAERSFNGSRGTHMESDTSKYAAMHSPITPNKKSTTDLEPEEQ